MAAVEEMKIALERCLSARRLAKLSISEIYASKWNCRGLLDKINKEKFE